MLLEFVDKLVEAEIEEKLRTEGKTGLSELVDGLITSSADYSVFLPQWCDYQKAHLEFFLPVAIHGKAQLNIPPEFI